MTEYDERYRKWRGKAPVPKPTGERTLWSSKCPKCGGAKHVAEATCELCRTIDEGLKRGTD